MIQFDNIPASIRKPGVYTEYNSTGAVSTLPTNEQEVLIVAPMLKTIEADYTKPVKLFSDVEAAQIFGEGSWLHLMARVAIKNNPQIRLNAIGVKDASAATAATATLTFAGTASSTGIISVKIAGVDYSISVANTEADTALATRLAAVINKDASCVVSANVSDKVITLTAKNKGEIGNQIDLSVQNSAKSVSITPITFSSGAKNPSIEMALASVAGAHYQIIISAFTDDTNITKLREHLVAVSSPIEKKPTIGVLGWRGTFATGTTLTEKINHERITVGWYKGAIEANPLIAAGYGAVIAKEEDPARPLNTLEIIGLTEVDETQKPQFSEVNQALFKGLTPLTIVNHRLQIMRAITTYTKSATNTDDPSYLDLTTIRTLDYIRKAVEQRIELRFPRDKKTKRIKSAVRSEVLDVMYRLEALEIVENVDVWKSQLLVQDNLQDVNRLDLLLPPDLVNGLHIVATQIKFVL
ncbi:phage tail protein [Mergibacter septicus]|uniref:phage tail sheath subtilisin-like domain-containing protein n=1 Tax=Mergibacter septicus TaxID=221402 RepID=UPI0011791ACE|nr:phage tail sheath subtilisin-like domain-containing protein [Mergibacter septicus]AWX14273.1 phage tail protein [Mergibacter septicus]